MSYEPSHRLPLKTKPPTPILSKYPSPQVMQTGGDGNLSMFLIFAIILIMGAIVAFVAIGIDTDTQCERKANGYPLISFQIDGSGDEIDCRYGTETKPIR